MNFEEKIAYFVVAAFVIFVIVTFVLILSSSDEPVETKDDELTKYFRAEASHISCTIGCTKYAQQMYQYLNATTVNRNLDICKIDCYSRIKIEIK